MKSATSAPSHLDKRAGVPLLLSSDLSMGYPAPVRDHINSTCQYSNSIGVARPKIVTITRT